MSDDSEQQRRTSGEPATSTRWDDPPLWSPWNFQNPKPNPEWQYDRVASAASREETIAADIAKLPELLKPPR
jgi:hypothetical protein